MPHAAPQRLAALLGDPVHHSLSPRIHNHWFARYRIPGIYLALRVAERDLAAALALLPRLGFLGFNVTMPHKQRALELVDRLDAVARRVGAVNTVLVMEDGALLGRNTDGEGFLASLKTARPAWRADAAPVVLLGAGGAARAIACALLDAGVPELRLVNRSRARAEALAADLADSRIRITSWRERSKALSGAGLLVNATSLGMHGCAELELDLDALPRAAVVADIVYAPRCTALLRRAQARGHPVVEGLGMLLYQAVPGFAHWGGVVPEVDERLWSLVAGGGDSGGNRG